MKNVCIWVSLLLISILPVSAQTGSPSLPLSPEFQQAVDKGTRTLQGMPGPHYFQNHASYQLEATFDPNRRRVNGHGRITYYNESPDALDRLVLRLYQNMYKPDAKHDFDLKEEEYTTGITLSNLMVNQQAAPIDPIPDSLLARTHAFVEGTNLIITLATPLLAGESIELEMDWRFTITDGSTVRMGTYGEHAYFVGYWYPQMAVYDDIYGWDVLPYNGLVEFYNDFSDFDISITAPADFLVWSTGMLTNAAEILAPTYLARYQLAQQVDTVVRIVGKEDYTSGAAITRVGATHTWHFKAENVPDASFALADYYYWDATSVEIDEPKRRVLVDACYKPIAKDFPEVAAFAREIILDLSTEVPGIPYPYPQMTAFNGETRGFGGGMEFPMMINDGTCFNLSQTFDLTYHEIAHTYFPFYMGINERRFAWMDEGWASFLPSDLVKEKGYSGVPMRQNVTMYESISGTSRQDPLMTESYTQSQSAYYPAAYYHPATAYHLLRLELGDEVFLQALQSYMANWAGKHPQPYDFFFAINEATGEDLSWFWKPWFFETGKADLVLKINQVKGKKIDLTIQRKGDMPVPVILRVEFKSGEDEILTYPASIWKDGETSIGIQEKFSGKVVAIRLGGADIPDKSSRNNRWELK